MKMESPQSLGKSVAVTATNRPIKIAYLVPYNENETTHLILDGIFYESYTRWSGIFTLIIPTKANDFLDPIYGKWLEFHDPDFIYSYLNIENDFKRDIERVYGPIAIIEHKLYEDNVTWRNFVPNWNYISPISSLTTVQSPHIRRSRVDDSHQGEVTVVTQYDRSSNDRFISDNFGISFNLTSGANPIAGMFKTLCFVEKDIPSYMNVGTTKTSSINEILKAISDRSATPISIFAMAHSEALPRIHSYQYSNSFNLIIGTSIKDRINFWNSRFFIPDFTGVANSLIISPEFFNHNELVKILGQYLNKNNHSYGNGPAITKIISSSQNRDTLEIFTRQLQAETFNSVQMDNLYEIWILPENDECTHGILTSHPDSVAFKIFDNDNTIQANLPEHYSFIAPRYKGMMSGDWIVMHDIERHNNLSQYSNMVDRWVFPKRQQLASAFTNVLGRVSRCCRLSLIPTSKNFHLHHTKNDRYSYDLKLPEDKEFFSHLLLKHLNTESKRDGDGYESMSISDKGQNLRGIISMFENLSSAYRILTNKYWRTVMRTAKEDSIRYLSFSMNKLESMLPNDVVVLKKLNENLRFSNWGEVKSYLKASLWDTLETLVQQQIFFQVHESRCDYCGHINCKNFDNMKTKNNCEICDMEYFASIDLDWAFQLNDFIHRTLIKHDGLTVLWALGFIQDYVAKGSFWYLPEVDFYESNKEAQSELKGEIDILCVADGVFYAIEVKVTATSLKQVGAIEKFIDKINRIQPDVAMMVFERVCVNDSDRETELEFLEQSFNRIKNSIAPYIILTKIIASDYSTFSDFPSNLGYLGARGRQFY